RVVHITVNNVAPQDVSAGPNQTVAEGSAVTLHGTFSDPGPLDTHTFTWHVTSDNGQVIADGNGQDFTFTPDAHSTYTVTCTVTDNHGAAASASAVVTVTNVAPVADAGPARTANEGDLVTLHGGFTDPGADTHTFTWHVTSDNGQVIADGNAQDFTFTPDA